jgi:hypothetical protein
VNLLISSLSAAIDFFVTNIVEKNIIGAVAFILSHIFLCLGSASILYLAFGLDF